jgi:hypothetical protein
VNDVVVFEDFFFAAELRMPLRHSQRLFISFGFKCTR